MNPIYTKAQVITALKSEIKRRELGPTAVLVFDSLIELMVPHGPLKQLPKALNMSEQDLAYLVKRDPRQVRYAVEDLLQADLLTKIPVREMDRRGRVVFSQECFDISPALVWSIEHLNR